MCKKDFREALSKGNWGCLPLESWQGSEGVDAVIDYALDRLLPLLPEGRRDLQHGGQAESCAGASLNSWLHKYVSITGCWLLWSAIASYAKRVFSLGPGRCVFLIGMFHVLWQIIHFRNLGTAGVSCNGTALQVERFEGESERSDSDWRLHSDTDVCLSFPQSETSQW